jgi:hypothetical protein
MSRTKVDPELLRQLDEAGDAPVGAVFYLRPGPQQKSLAPAEAEAIAKGLLRRAQQESGIAPEKEHVLRNLGSFVVSASAPFVRKLLDREEILAATANRRQEDLLIKPVSSKPVKGPRPGGRSGDKSARSE